MKHDFVIINDKGKSVYQSLIDRLVKDIMSDLDDIEHSHDSSLDVTERENAMEEDVI